MKWIRAYNRYDEFTEANETFSCIFCREYFQQLSQMQELLNNSEGNFFSGEKLPGILDAEVFKAVQAIEVGFKRSEPG